jgi:hypothetical protein
LIICRISHAELRPKLVCLVRTAHLSAKGGCPKIERVGQRASSGGRDKVLACTALASLSLLSLVLLLLLELLKVLLALRLGEELSLILLGLDGLDPDHLELQHLHLDLSLLLGHHVGGEARAEWHAVGVHAAGSLVVRKVVVGPVDGGGHGCVPVEEDVLGYFWDLVIFLFLWENVGVVLGGETRDVESAGRGCCVRDWAGNGADAARAEACEKGSAVVGVCGSHCFGGRRPKR